MRNSRNDSEMRRFKRPLSLTNRPLEPCPEVGDDSTTYPYARQRRVVQPRPRRSDTLVRGTVLAVLVVVTFVLYVMLWELERVSFAAVSAPMARPLNVDVDNRTGTVSSAGSSETDNHGILHPWPPPITNIFEDYEMNEDTAENKDDNLDDHAYDSEDRSDTSNDKGSVSVSTLVPPVNAHPYRFLLPVRIGEQESKARIHLVQLLLLARRLNRTIVLPNVGKSRMSACAPWPFDAYYDTSALAREHRGDALDTGLLTMDLEQFVKWVDERLVQPSSLVVSMDSVRRDGSELEDAPFIVDKAEVEPKFLSCLDSRLGRMRLSVPEMALSISFHSGASKVEPNTSTRLIQLLSNPLDIDMNTTPDADSEFDLLTGPGYNYALSHINTSFPSLSEIDVLVLDYNLRHSLFPASTQPMFHLHYTPAFYDLADRLADNLGPFLGVHWRMETVPVQNLAWCAAALVSRLQKHLRENVKGENVQYVWLATDHPRPLSSFIVDGDPYLIMNGAGNGKDGDSGLPGGGFGQKSSTFTALTSEHDNAIMTLVEAFQAGGELDVWTLTDLAEQLHRYPYVEGKLDVNETLLSDSGVLGILDKLVIVQASAFFSGSTECSKTSSFSKQVIEARKESFEAEQGKGAIRSVVEYFGR